ncbi:MAG TPA: hypothetical protein VFF13_04855 [archaeon]|nr:hypothetical protein [archaeon]
MKNLEQDNKSVLAVKKLKNIGCLILFIPLTVFWLAFVIGSLNFFVDTLLKSFIGFSINFVSLFFTIVFFIILLILLAVMLALYIILGILKENAANIINEKFLMYFENFVAPIIGVAINFLFVQNTQYAFPDFEGPAWLVYNVILFAVIYGILLIFGKIKDKVVPIFRFSKAP